MVDVLLGPKSRDGANSWTFDDIFTDINSCNLCFYRAALYGSESSWS